MEPPLGDGWRREQGRHLAVDGVDLVVRVDVDDARVVVLEIVGVIATRDPTWYVLLQVLIGAVQFAIGILMLASYRRADVWGDA